MPPQLLAMLGGESIPKVSTSSAAKASGYAGGGTVAPNISTGGINVGGVGFNLGSGGISLLVVAALFGIFLIIRSR